MFSSLINIFKTVKFTLESDYKCLELLVLHVTNHFLNKIVFLIKSNLAALQKLLSMRRFYLKQFENELRLNLIGCKSLL